MEIPGGTVIVDSLNLNLAQEIRRFYKYRRSRTIIKDRDTIVAYSLCPPEIGDTLSYSYLDVPQVTLGETTLVFLHTTFNALAPHGPDTFDILGWEWGKFNVSNQFVRPSVDIPGIKNCELELDLVKRLIQTGIEFPATVDAKIDTIYEEAKALYNANVSYETIRDLIYNKLEGITSLILK